MTLIRYALIIIQKLLQSVLLLFIISTYCGCFMLHDAPKETGSLVIKNISGETLIATITLHGYESDPKVLYDKDIKQLVYFSTYSAKNFDFSFPKEATKLVLARQNKQNIVLNYSLMVTHFKRIKGLKYSWVLILTPKLLAQFSDGE